MELHLGKMTGQEIAEWFNIKYTTYRCKTKSYLEKLKMFCKFKQYRGYIEIEEIFVAKYDKKLNRQLESLFLNEVYENPLTTVVGFSNKYQVSKYQTTQVRNKMFGATPAKLGMREEGGTAGIRSMVWAIKLDDYNNYREMTDHETEAFHMIIHKNYMNVDSAKIAEEHLIRDYCAKENKTVQEYLELLDDAGANSWKIILRNFQEEIGHPIARVDKYSVNFYKTEEEYLKDLLNKQNREHYDMFPQVYDDTKNNEVYDF